MKGLAIVLLAVASGCSPSTQTETTAPPPTEVFATTARAEAGDLSVLVFSKAPIGYVPVPDETRPETIDDVAQRADDAEAERVKLQSRGFVRAFARTWSSDDDSGNIVLAVVYEFQTARGAQDEQQSGIDDARAEGDSMFSVEGVHGAIGIERKPPAGSEANQDTFFAVSFVRATHYYLVTVGGPTPHSRQEITALAQQMNSGAR